MKMRIIIHLFGIIVPLPIEKGEGIIALYDFTYKYVFDAYFLVWIVIGALIGAFISLLFKKHNFNSRKEREEFYYCIK